jgi:hypothetical protein
MCFRFFNIVTLFHKVAACTVGRAEKLIPFFLLTASRCSSCQTFMHAPTDSYVQSQNGVAENNGNVKHGGGGEIISVKGAESFRS